MTFKMSVRQTLPLSRMQVDCVTSKTSSLADLLPQPGTQSFYSSKGKVHAHFRLSNLWDWQQSSHSVWNFTEEFLGEIVIVLLLVLTPQAVICYSCSKNDIIFAVFVDFKPSLSRCMSKARGYSQNHRKNANYSLVYPLVFATQQIPHYT